MSCSCNSALVKYKAEYALFKSKEDSGYDVRSAEESFEIEPMGIKKVSLGLKLELPIGFEAQLRPRSGLNAKGILCQFGTIDQGYRGDICAVLINLSGKPFKVEKGDRVAQLIIAKTANTEVDRVLIIGEDTERGSNGFGSSGTK